MSDLLLILLIGLIIAGLGIRLWKLGFMETKNNDYWKYRSFGQAGRSLALQNCTHATENYKVFTTKFDVEVDARSLWSELGTPRQRLATTWAEDQAQRTGVRVIDYTEGYKSLFDNSKATCLVTVLTDHSGSTRGQIAAEVASAIGVFGEQLEKADIAFEVLGFTTRSWMGGKSRREWLLQDKPAMPGRLCDLMHVVHKAADDTFSETKHDLLLLKNSAWLRENVDGEAILWAKKRFENSGYGRWICIVVSDGAPVDDSTLDANRIGENYPILHDHLMSVAKTVLEEPNCMIAGFGVGFDVSRYYKTSHFESEQRALFESLSKLFVTAAKSKF